MFLNRKIQVYFQIYIFCFISVNALAETISGNAKVIDGDSINISNVSIRLYGIDAPEAKQKCHLKNGKEWNCGIDSKNMLKKLIKNSIVFCIGKKYDRYKRLIAKCYVDNKNIESFMVKNGWAVAYRRYSKDYIEEEIEARENKLGIWQGEFQLPEVWRRSKK